MRIEVDPAALIAAGQQTGALGAQLGRLSAALGSALSGGISSGMDPAGLNFGMKYGHQASEFASAVADAANAFSSVGMLLEATGHNYRNADAASTIGGPGATGGVGGAPAKTLAAHVPPGPNGVTVPPPSKWYLVQPLLQILPGVGLFAGAAMTWALGQLGDDGRDRDAVAQLRDRVRPDRTAARRCQGRRRRSTDSRGCGHQDRPGQPRHGDLVVGRRGFDCRSVDL